MQADIQKHYDELRQAEANAKYWLQQYETQLKADHEAKVAALEAEHAGRVEAIKQQFEQESSGVRQRVTAAMARLKYAAAPWTIDAWQGFPADIPDGAVKDSLRAGVIKREFAAAGVSEVPLMLPLVGEGHILVVSVGAAKAQARLLLQSIVLRAMLLLANDNTEFVMIDPFGMGANFPFQALPVSIRGETIYAEEDEINAQLRRMTDVIRGGKTEKLYILCAADFPRRFSEDALHRITSIAQQGVNASIHAIVHVDSDVALPGGYDPAALMQASSVIFMTPDGVKAKLDGNEYEFLADSPPEKRLLDALLKKIGG